MRTQSMPLPGPERPPWPRGIGASIALWSAFWSVLLAAIAAGFAVATINDAHFRAQLALDGVRAKALLTGQRCGRGPTPRFLVPNGQGGMIGGCPSGEDVPRRIRNGKPGLVVDVVIKRGDPRFFVLAPDGRVPQRDLTGLWRRWSQQTVALLLIYLPGVAAFIWLRRRNRAHV